MRRSALMLLALSMLCMGVFSQTSNRKLVDITADLMTPIKIGDSSVLNMLGNVVFYHNGAIITCDSAIRYSDKRIECFRNVVVNKQNTYVYGDRADYNGELNVAKIYAPIIKMVDDDATLYTYNFSFNTLENIGMYSGGGTMKQKDNLLESDHGYYYADTRDVIAVREVEINSPDYKIKSDSVGYNMDTEVATFCVKTYIWNSKGEILSADRGLYKQATSDYKFTSNAYILTEKQELWADSLDYNSVAENAVMHRNIQLRDEDQKVMAFGDFGQYWGNPGDALLTQNPSMVSFDPKEDTLYMRSDSMFLYTVSRDFAIKSDSVAVEDSGEEEIISESKTPEQKALAEGEKKSGLTPEIEQTIATDTTAIKPTTLQVEESLDTGGEPPLSKQDKKRRRQEQKQLERAAKDAANANVLTPKNDRPQGTARDSVVLGEDSVSVRALADSSANVKETASTTATATAKEATAKGVVPGASSPAKSSGTQSTATTTPNDGIATTTELLTPTQQQADSALFAAPEVSEDTVQRIVKAYKNVKIFRNDFQAVCDSLVGFSLDSTLHLYIEPVLWNENNQIKSEIIDVYTKNQQLYKAIFTGAPLMSSEIDTLHYNQVKGKIMEAFFRDNSIYRTDVNGNGQTIYYITDDDTGMATDLLVVDCADITFLMADQQMETIIYRNEPVYSIFPLDKIPADQPMFLDGFVWEIKRKPALADVFTRTIRPSQRETYEALPQPTYPLTEAIMRNKARMIRDDIWRERNDTVSPLAREFINSLGY